MSITYDYDVFISCAFEDRFYAQTLARKLQALEFLVWCDAEEAAAAPSSLSLRSEAIENSATCVLLMGPGGKCPWLDATVRDAIRFRVSRTHEFFRVVTVALPGADVDVVRRRTGSFMKRFEDLQWPEAVVHFKESLDEEPALNELILGIRGVASSGQADWLEEDFGESVRLRAQNVLHIDWLRLFLDFNPAVINTPVRNDERPYHLSVVNPVGAMEGDRSHVDTAGREHHLGPLELLRDEIEEDNELSIVSQPTYETLREFSHPMHRGKVPVSLLTSISRHVVGTSVAIVLIMAALLAGASIYVRQVYLTHHSRGIGPIRQVESGQNIEKDTTPAPAVLADTSEHLHGHDNEESRKTDGTGLREKMSSARSLTKRGGDTTKERMATLPPGAPTIKPPVLDASTASKTQLLESGGPETSNPYAEEYRKAFANISGIFIKKLDGKAINEEAFLKTFGEALGGEGINVFVRKEDRHLANLSAEMRVVSNESKGGGYGIVILTVRNQSNIVVGEFYTRTHDHLNNKVVQAEQVARELNRQIRSCVEDARPY